MRYFTPTGTDMKASVVAQGCMRIAGLSDGEVDRMIGADLAAGINFFDHADIYAGGRCEEKFGGYLARHPGARDGMILQTKCGIIRGKRYDHSAEHIVSCVEGSLRRLKTDSVDVLLLHRPDALTEPEEVAKAFDMLHEAGKVRYFGVSNYNSFQIELLQKYTPHKLIFDQLRFGPAHTCMIDAGLNVNMKNSAAVVRDGMTLDYCRLHDVTIQPWSPFRARSGSFLRGPFHMRLRREIRKLAARYGASDSAVVLAWILRHPARMQPIVGSTSPERITGMAAAADITLTHEEWYDIYRAAGHRLP